MGNIKSSSSNSNSDTGTGFSTKKIIKLFEEKGVSVHKDADGIRGRIIAALRELNQKEVNEDLNNIIHLFEEDNSKEMEEALDVVNKRYIEVKKGKSKPILLPNLRVL